MRASASAAVVIFCLLPPVVATEEPVTVNPHLQEVVKLPACLKGKTFYVGEIAGRAENSSVATAHSTTSPTPSWLPVSGVILGRQFTVESINWQRDPREIVREAVADSFESAGALTKDEALADYSLSINLRQFGFVEATWREYYSKLEMTVTLKNQKTGALAEVLAFGTAVVNKQDGRKRIAQATQSGLEIALRRAVANFLYSAKLKTAVE